MDDRLPDDLARTVLAAYASLPKNGKPRALSPSQHSWTVLAGFCLVDRAAKDGSGVQCVSLGSVDSFMAVVDGTTVGAPG